MIGPDIPAHVLAGSSSRNDESSEEEGPAPAPVPVGPQIPSHLTAGPSKPTASTAAAEEEEDDDDDYAPQLPPDLAAARASTAKKVLGPTFPPSMTGRWYDDDDDDDDVGPRPLPQGYVAEEKDGVQEFLEKEERRRKQIEVCPRIISGEPISMHGRIAESLVVVLRRRLQVHT